MAARPWLQGPMALKSDARALPLGLLAGCLSTRTTGEASGRWQQAAWPGSTVPCHALRARFGNWEVKGGRVENI